ncbi:MAG: magnesium chelatase subunit H [Pseudomonadota bacterium]
MRKPTSHANATPVRVVLVTLDNHLARTVARAEARLRPALPGLSLKLHAAGMWQDDPDAIAACKADIENADIVIATMLFLDEHISAILPALKARRADCDAMVSFMAAGEVIQLTRMGRFEMGGNQSAAIRLLKRLRGSNAPNKSSGAKQLKMLRRLPKLLRYIPGTAQDVRAYFLAMQYWLAGSEENVAGLVAHLVDRYAAGPRESLKGLARPQAPVDYPDVGLYHPDVGISADVNTVRKASQARAADGGTRGTVGLLLMRAYVLSADCAHYDGVIKTLEARGLTVVPAFAAGLDNRPVLDTFFSDDAGDAAVDAIISLTGFSLVGGPAYNDCGAAAEALKALGVPYHVCQPLEFQTLNQWRDGNHGLLPVEATMMVAIPELDGATNPTVFAGRSADADDMAPDEERVSRLADRVARQICLAKTPREERKLAVVLFNFPPNAGATGTAAFLAVYESLFNTLRALKEAGYAVDVPASVDALRDTILQGNRERFGADANVAHTLSRDDHVAGERHLEEIEAAWGPAPGRHNTDGSKLHILGAQFGNVFVGVQPAFGYEGDPMRLLFEGNFAPTHAFSAFYRHLNENFDAVLHFGTHGALEFMPGKQVGLSRSCWPDRLIDTIPNINLYAANNPSEGMLAKRRAAATLVGHLTPAVTQAGLYKGLATLKASLDHWRSQPEAQTEHLAETIQAEAAELNLADAEPLWEDPETAIAALTEKVLECEYALIPHGLHVVGEALSREERTELLAALGEARFGGDWREEAALIASGEAEEPVAAAKKAIAAPSTSVPYPTEDEDADPRATLLEADAHLRATDTEINALVNALDGRFVPPGPAGDLIRKPDMLPTGRNIHGFDPFRLPSAFALADGFAQAERIIARQVEETGAFPETIALVLWGTDNLKSEGAPIAQALALMGARPRLDAYGRVAGAELIPLSELGRPRVDVIVTLSGIFRDLLPMQTRLLAEAAYLAASADEPEADNAVKRHALAYAAAHDCDLETASLRVFSNAEGAYGSNVNQLVTSGQWDDEDELADMFSKRKGFAYGRKGKPAAQPALLQTMLGDVTAAHQNLESVELGITTIDHYFDTLGGISRAVARAKGGERVPVLISDQTRGDAKVRTLDEQVALETRTRALNPKWTEGMLKHGYEGVRQIEASVTNTVGWSATAGGVQPWVYERLSETYVLDEDMRRRLTELNPAATQKVASRLLEAHERSYWSPDPETLAALEAAADEIEDRLEGVVAA